MNIANEARSAEEMNIDFLQKWLEIPQKVLIVFNRPYRRAGKLHSFLLRLISLVVDVA